MFVYRLVSILIVGSYLMSALLVNSWQEVDQIWYRPFAIWLLFILLAAWLEQRRKHDEF